MDNEPVSEFASVLEGVWNQHMYQRPIFETGNMLDLPVHDLATWQNLAFNMEQAAIASGTQEPMFIHFFGEDPLTKPMMCLASFCMGILYARHRMT